MKWILQQKIIKLAYQKQLYLCKDEINEYWCAITIILFQDTLPKRDNHLQCESYNVLKQSNNDVQEPQTTMQVM